MATSEETSRRDDYIEFTLKVKAGKEKDWIEFGLNLNPKDRLLSISDSFSSYERLNHIFNHIISELKIINERTELYNRATDVNAEALEVNIQGQNVSFNEKYQQNFRPEFGKIDRIVHRHNSPGVSSVSYNRVYNGDIPPK
jgi:hypothetical protein